MSGHDHPSFSEDLRRLRAMGVGRRDVLRMLAAGALLPSCVTGGADRDTADPNDTSGGSCPTLPPETEGPYPGDGTNGPNALALAGIVRSDIRTSVGTASGTAAGIVLTITFTLVDSSDGCNPTPGRAVYLWHCDRDGAYSMYAGSASGENYLRGVQVADEDGRVTFTTIFPACYDGRWPHMHFEVFESATDASNGGNAILTSQLGFPKATCDEVYQQDGYEDSVSNLSRVSLSSDGIFRDGTEGQIPTMGGSIADGLTASLVLGVDG